jgi:hypothetical protein
MDDRMSCDEIHHRHHLLGERAEEALPRLLELRARLMRASSSVINEPFRNELLRLIDEGR